MDTLKIYKLITTNSNKVYIGSTKYPLDYRKCQHEFKYHNMKYGHGGIDVGKPTSGLIFNAAEPDLSQVKIELLEEKIVANNQEARELEQSWIDKIPCVNFARALRVGSTLCECGGVCHPHGKKKHLKTNKHIQFVASHCK